MNSDDEYLRTEDLAARVHLSPATIHNRHSQGRLPVRPIKVGRRLLWPRVEVEAWLDDLKRARAASSI